MNIPVRTLKIWFDGVIVNEGDANISLANHSLFYGSAVFEGIRCYDTRKGPAVFRLKDHVQRLFHSAKIMGMNPSYTEDEIIDAITNIVRQNQLNECYIRPIFFYGGKMDLLPVDTPLHAAVLVWRWGKYLARDVVTVKTSPHIRIYPCSDDKKTKVSGNYANSILALLDARKDGFDKALFLDTNNHVAEGAGENIFFVKDRSLFTPTNVAIVSGVTRASIIKIAVDLGYEIIERDISYTEISQFSEAFFTGTASQINAIGKIDSHIFNGLEEGSAVKEIKGAYQKAVQGTDSRYSGWLHHIVL